MQTRTIPFCTSLGIFSKSSSVKAIEKLKGEGERRVGGGGICLVLFHISSTHRCFLIPLAYIFHSP